MSVRPEIPLLPLPAVTHDAALFRVLVERGTDVVFLIDVEAKQCIYVSPSVQDLLGWDAQSLRGRALSDLMHPDDATMLARAAGCRKGRTPYPTLSRMQRRDGASLWVQATASAVFIYQGRAVTVFTVAAAPEVPRPQSGLRSAHQWLRQLVAEVSGGPEHLASQTGTYDVAVETLAAALELRDDETGHHARRVTELALALTRVVDPQLARDPELRYGFLLHDIGKIGIPDSILLNPGRLEECDLRILHMHTTLGENLISMIPFLSGTAHDVVAYHHERWDGGGYPWGLAGVDIPLAARIFAVVDTFDAITSDRPYRRARSVDEAIREIEDGMGSQFDPAIVRAFMPLAHELTRPDHPLHLLRD